MAKIAESELCRQTDKLLERVIDKVNIRKKTEKVAERKTDKGNI